MLREPSDVHALGWYMACRTYRQTAEAEPSSEVPAVRLSIPPAAAVAAATAEAVMTVRLRPDSEMLATSGTPVRLTPLVEFNSCVRLSACAQACSQVSNCAVFRCATATMVRSGRWQRAGARPA
jgi:hypothetical protein